MLLPIHFIITLSFQLLFVHTKECNLEKLLLERKENSSSLSNKTEDIRHASQSLVPRQESLTLSTETTLPTEYSVTASEHTQETSSIVNIQTTTTEHNSVPTSVSSNGEKHIQSTTVSTKIQRTETSSSIPFTVGLKPVVERLITTVSEPSITTEGHMVRLTPRPKSRSFHKKKKGRLLSSHKERVLESDFPDISKVHLGDWVLSNSGNSIRNFAQNPSQFKPNYGTENRLISGLNKLGTHSVINKEPTRVSTAQLNNYMRLKLPTVLSREKQFLIPHGTFLPDKYRSGNDENKARNLLHNFERNKSEKFAQKRIWHHINNNNTTPTLKLKKLYRGPTTEKPDIDLLSSIFGFDLTDISYPERKRIIKMKKGWI